MCTAFTSINTLLGCVRRRGWGVDRTARRLQSAPTCVFPCWCQAVAKTDKETGNHIYCKSAALTELLWFLLPCRWGVQAACSGSFW